MEEARKSLKNQILGFKNWGDRKKGEALNKLQSLTAADVDLWTGVSDVVLQTLIEKPTAVARVPYVGGLSEGISARTYRSKRLQTVKRVLELVQTRGYLVLRGSPEAGKTSLLQLCYDAAQDSDVFGRVFWFPAHNMHDSDTFQESFERACKCSWKEAWSPPSSPGSRDAPETVDLLFIDEGHLLFAERRQSNDLWTKLKFLAGAGKQLPQENRLRVILAVMYGFKPSGVRAVPATRSQLWQADMQARVTAAGGAHASNLAGQGAESMEVDVLADVNEVALESPMAFRADHVIGVLHDGRSGADMPALALDLSEYDELIESFRQNCRLIDALSDQTLKTAIFEITNGLVGLITSILDHMVYKLCNETFKEGRADDMLRYILTSPSLYSCLGVTRSFILREALTAKYTEVLNTLLQGRFPDRNSMRTVWELQRRGLLHVSADGGVGFLSDLGFFVKSTLRRMSASRLRQGLGRGRNLRPLESTYQHEFHAAGNPLLPAPCSMSPDVGTVYDAGGYSDFYVRLSNNKEDAGWVIELLRDGVGQLEHAKRLWPGGKYAGISSSGYCLIDFRPPGSGGQPRQRLPNFYYVSFSQDYSQALVTGPDGTCEQLALAA